MPHTIAPFVKKTFELVSDPSTDNIVCWSKDGKYFCILEPFKFQSDVLPIYFNHKNTSSFIRQLNIYNFHKIPSTKDSMEFQHPQFIKNGLHQLQYITRKVNCGKRSRKQRNINIPVDFSLNDLNELTNSSLPYNNIEDILSNKNEVINILSLAINKHNQDKQRIHQLSNEIEDLKSKPDKKRPKYCKMESSNQQVDTQIPFESIFSNEEYTTSKPNEDSIPDYSNRFDLLQFLEF